MAQRMIPLVVDNEHVKGAGVNVGAAGSHDAVVFELRFSELWRGLTKRVVWTDALGETSATTLLTAQMAVDEDTYQTTVPATPLAYAGKMCMVITGVYVNTETGKETVKAVTEAAFFRVMDSYLNATSQSDIDPTLADQLQAEVDALLDVILDARAAAKDAEAWAVGQIGGEDVDDTDQRYHNNAKYYAEAAKDDAATAAGAATDADEAAALAGQRAASAENSMNIAAQYSDASALSAGAASDSEQNAALSEENAKEYAQRASGYANAAELSKEGADKALEDAIKARADAIAAAQQAAADMGSAGQFAQEAVEARDAAEGFADEIGNKNVLAESYAHGGTGTREGEDTDNARYYMEQAKEIAGGDFVTNAQFDEQMETNADSIAAIKNGSYGTNA